MACEGGGEGIGITCGDDSSSSKVVVFVSMWQLKVDMMLSQTKHMERSHTCAVPAACLPAYTSTEALQHHMRVGSKAHTSCGGPCTTTHAEQKMPDSRGKGPNTSGSWVGVLPNPTLSGDESLNHTT
jgi:hypothetical protein